MTTTNNFDFNKIGKRMPYSTPDGFFDTMEEDIMKRIHDLPSTENPADTHADTPQADTKAPHTAHKVRTIALRIMAAAAVIALAFIVSLKMNSKPADTMDEVDKAFSQLSAADQQFMLSVYQADVFMDE